MPECVKVECQEPEHVRHGYKKPRSAIWDYKSQITYFCQPGYYLVGNPKRGKDIIGYDTSLVTGL